MSASGTLPLSYQWRFNGASLASQTGTSLALVNVQLTNAGSYSVVVTNLFGATNSANALLTVNGVAPAIVSQPVSQVVTVGANAAFSVTASGTPPLSYQWRFNGASLARQTAASLVLTNVQFTNAGSYSVVVTNLFGSTNSANALLTVNSSSGCVKSAPGLVSWWPGEGNAKDIVGTNDGTAVGSLVYTNGEVGQTFSFNGSSAYVQIASSPSLNPAGSFSIECWINPGRQDLEQVIVSKWTDSAAQPNQRSYCFVAEPNGALRFPISDAAHQWDASFHIFDTANHVIGTNTWSHVAAVYDQAAGARRIYVNGVEVAERIDSPITVLNGTATVAIGAEFASGPAAYFFTGMIDELAFYNRALSAGEIQAIYAAGSAGKCFNHPPTATNATGATRQNQPMVIATEKLLLFASDPDGDALSLSGVSATSTNNGPVLLGTGVVTYTPATNYVGPDRFTWTVTDGRGGTASAYALINVWSADSPSGNMLIPVPIMGGYQVGFVAIPQRGYTVWRAISLSGPWTSLATVTTDTNGFGIYADTHSPPAGAFYRTTYP